VDLPSSQSGHGGGCGADIRTSSLHQCGGDGCVERRRRNWKMSAVEDDDDRVSD